MSTRVLDQRDRRPQPPSGGGGNGSSRDKPSDGGASASSEINPHKWIILVGLITAAIMEVLDTTIINVALPQMAGNLNATIDEIAWVSTGYILSNVIVLPMTAWLGQRFGRKRYLVFSILLFIVASFFCGASKTLNALVFWRILQGAGGAALLSTAQATLRQIFPKEQQGLVQTLFILGIVMAPTLGPAVGGYITDNYNWPWVFYVNIPIGLVAAFLVGNFLHDAPNGPKAGPIDLAGIGLLTVGLGSLQYVLEEGKRDDWFDSVLITRLAILAAVSLSAMLAWELSPRNKSPVVNFRVLKNRDLSAGLILFLALGFGLYGAIFIFPQFTQNVLGFSPTATGLVLLPGGLATGISAMVCGRITSLPKPPIDIRFLILFGMAIFILSMWMLGHLSTASGEPDTRLALIIRGLGLGFLFTPINFVVFASLKGPEIQQASGLINLARQLGGSFGIAVLNTYIYNMEAYHRANLVSNFYAGNALYDQRIAGATATLISNGSSATDAHMGALKLLDGTVMAQAATMSYNDAFLLLGLTFLFAAPAVFLLRKPKKAPAGGGGH
ncbi:MAG: DHA2 family efflux MFS transporter permease subunit [Janthinobacterium lividum]